MAGMKSYCAPTLPEIWKELPLEHNADMLRTFNSAGSTVNCSVSVIHYLRSCQIFAYVKYWYELQCPCLLNESARIYTGTHIYRVLQVKAM